MFFSTIIFFLEKDETDSPFTSIPSAYWWCIVTVSFSLRILYGKYFQMTTVGYGDSVPTTAVGKIVASAAIMCGVLV